MGPSSVYPVCLHPLFHPHQLSELFPHQPWGWWFIHLYNPWPWYCQPPPGCIPSTSKNPTICSSSDLLLPCSSPTSLPCPAQVAYHAPAPSYHAPVAAHGPAANYGEKCSLDYVEESAEVCVPTLETNCDQEDGGNGVELHQDEKCHDVVRTVCVERHDVIDNEVCAYSYQLKPVVSEAQLVEAHWEKVCHEDVVCLNPHHQVSSAYGAPAYCHEEIHETCHLEPTLVPVIRPVTISLPQPVEVCINKQIILPDIECHKVTDR